MLSGHLIPTGPSCFSSVSRRSQVIPRKTGALPEIGQCIIGSSNETTDAGRHRTGKIRSIIGNLFDLANLVTLAGLLSSIFAITFAIRADFDLAAIGLVLAFFFDGIDGPVARRISGRTDDDRAFGGNLDSLVDMAGAGVTLAVVLLAYGEFEFEFVFATEEEQECEFGQSRAPPRCISKWCRGRIA